MANSTPGAGIEMSRRRCPAAHRRQRSGDAAQGRVEPRRALHGRVDDDVEEGRYQGQPGGQQVDGEDEDDLTSQDHCETEGQCCRWRHFSRRQWSVTSATHDGVDIAFQIVVEHAGPPGGQRRTQQRHHQDQGAVDPMTTDEKAKGRRHQYYGDNARFRQFGIGVECACIHLSLRSTACCRQGQRNR